MSEGANLFGEEHVRRYRETGGEVGHIWKKGSKILLLTTKGRKTGEPRTTPLIYENDGDRYVVVASKGGAPQHPGWYRNLSQDAEVEVQVKDDVFRARARTAGGGGGERGGEPRGQPGRGHHPPHRPGAPPNPRVRPPHSALAARHQR